MEFVKTLKVLSIDIGIINLGYVYCTLEFNQQLKKYHKYQKYYLDENYLIDVIECNRVNLTNMKHSVVKACDCKLHHDYCIPDYVDHFIQEHSKMFETTDVILIERQPPMGVTNVQDLIFSKFRDKVILVNQGSVHKYFIMSKDYNKRKVESEKIATKYLCSFKNFYDNIRKHDISDAMLMIIYYYWLKNKELVKKNNVSSIDFEQFRFKP